MKNEVTSITAIKIYKYSWISFIFSIENNKVAIAIGKAKILVVNFDRTSDKLLKKAHLNILQN